jgi:hypothetical protein
MKFKASTTSTSSNEADMAAYAETYTITADAAADYTIDGLDWANEVVFAVSGITSDTITPKISPFGSISSAVEPIDMATRAGETSTDVGNGIFRLEMCGSKLIFTSSGTESKTIEVCAKVTNRATSVS